MPFGKEGELMGNKNITKYILGCIFMLSLSGCGIAITPAESKESVIESDSQSEETKESFQSEELSQESETETVSESIESEQPSTPSQSEHEHTFSNTLTYDSNTHWYPSTCGHDVKKDEEAHTFIVSNSKEATYEEAGYAVYTCDKCAYSYREDIEALHHNYSDTWSYDSTQHWHQCTDLGYTDLKKDIGYHVLVVIAHLEPTYDDAGWTVYGCESCDYEFREDYGQLQHQFDGYGYDDNFHWSKCIDEGYEDDHFNEEPHMFGTWVTTKEPTETEDGLKQRTCATCEYVQSETLPSYQAQTLLDLEFELSEDETYYLVKKASESIVYAYIPSTYKGLPVKEIKNDAFDGCSLLKTVVLPTSVTKIGSNAFYNCSSLTSINLNDNIVEIGNSAFSHCDLESIHIPANLKTINNFVFAYNERISSINFPEGVTSIGEHACICCKALTDVSLPNTLVSIGDGAFTVCNKLERITIPENVTTIGKGAFESDPLLRTVIFNTNKITRFEERLFVGSGIESIIIPDSVTSIGNSCFFSCNSLENVTLGKGVTKLEKFAFMRCQNIENFYYNAIECRDVGEHIFGYDYDGSEYNATKGSENVVFGDGVKYIPNIFHSSSKLESLTIPSSVEEIEERAFQGTNITYFDFNGENVKRIGSGAFSSALKEGFIYLELPNIEFVSGFSWCTAIRSVIFGDKLEEIDSSAFYGCSRLNHLELGNNVTKIGSEAFKYCDITDSYIIPTTVKEIGSEAIQYSDGAVIYLENPDTTLWDSRFGVSIEKGWYQYQPVHVVDEGFEILKDENFEYIVIDTNSVKIVNCLFDGNELTIPDTVVLNSHAYNIVGIERCAFTARCPNKLTLGQNITKIGYSAFRSNKIKEVITTSNLMTIEDCAFNYCQNLERVFIHTTNSNAEFAERSFYQCNRVIVYQEGNNNFFDEKETTVRKNVASNYEPIIVNGYECFMGDGHLSLLKYRLNETSVTIPETLTYKGTNYHTGLSQRAYRSCLSIKEITIPSSISLIPAKCFEGCTNLETVNFADELTVTADFAIEDYAFSNCSSLTSITLPEYLKTLEGDPFGNNCGLEEIFIPQNVRYITHSTYYEIFSVFTGTNLKRIDVDEDNEYFKSVDGILFYKTGNLYRCPINYQGTSVKIDDTDVSVLAYAFYGNKNIVSLYLNIDKIGAHALNECQSLKTLFINFNGTINDSNYIGFSYHIENIYYLCSYSEYVERGLASKEISNGANKYYYNNNEETKVAGRDWYYNESNEPVIWE